MIHHLTRLFPLWALLACALAWFFPQWFRDYQPGIMPLAVWLQPPRLQNPGD